MIDANKRLEYPIGAQPMPEVTFSMVSTTLGARQGEGGRLFTVAYPNSTITLAGCRRWGQLPDTKSTVLLLR
jgi:hypothetical protein